MATPSMKESIGTILVTGGHGFIGSHVAKHIYDQGDYYVKIIDIAPTSLLRGKICHEFIQGNLCDFSTCVSAVKGVDIVLHFAAVMGGMGMIHSDNDFAIYEENHRMTQNLLRAISLPPSTVTWLLYSSSACVYPASLQSDAADINLRECDVFNTPNKLPNPQGLYGLEKLNSEFLITQLSNKIETRIARLHNVFGPGGCWNTGREKAPAAFLRKALACRLLTELDPSQKPGFEVWGDGTQRRSFLYIDDAVKAIMKLLFSSCSSPVNIGSDRSVTIRKLAEIALGCAETEAEFLYDTSKPIGVASRNSDNNFSCSTLDWSPTTTLEDGMSKTYAWMLRAAKEYLVGTRNDEMKYRETLRALASSQVINLESERITFAILLPVTSRGFSDPDDCIRNLHNFVQSLLETSWRDVHGYAPDSTRRFQFIIYLAIDADDHFLLDNEKAYNLILSAGIPPTQVRTILSNHTKGHVCAIWRDCARRAYDDGCDYFILMGEDVVLRDEGWMRKAHSAFLSLSQDNHTPFGLACVAFMDESFPGMPTFPIIHRIHMDIFAGEVIPGDFINQDGDPFLFQLYRRFGTSTMFDCRLTNTIGGASTARYEKHHAMNWTFGTLDGATRAVESWLSSRFHASELETWRKLTLDIIVPCYRVDPSILDKILTLKYPQSMSAHFIIIVDNPSASDLPTLLYTYSHRPDVRIRVNVNNEGASFSRNRGLSESAAEWVYFIDDDVIPSANILFAIEPYIRETPTAAGFVCNTKFPSADSIYTAAIHLSGVTYFWSIAKKIKTDIPWGVTANLVVRRNTSKNVPDGIMYSTTYPKTGGGEDIDYCRQKRESSIKNGGQGFIAAPDVIVTHPWWNQGRRSYWRFHMWSVGDGHLIQAYPEHTYVDYSPNSAEWIFACSVPFALGIATWSEIIISYSLKALFAVILANILHDCWRHLIRHPGRASDMNTSVKGILWLMAVIESTFIRMFSEMGRLRGCIARGEVSSVGRRFDWFAGRFGNGPKEEERRNSIERLALCLIFFAFSIRAS